jgi:O-antigen/teichoic acid export membrane protein
VSSVPPASGPRDLQDDGLLGPPLEAQALTLARNVSARYAGIVTEAVLGLLLLPFNLAHLGAATYGVWVLAASVTSYFSTLDLGYSGALVKYVAHYRARRDVRGLNEILSSAFGVFAALGTVAYIAAVIVAALLGHLFHLTPSEVHTGRLVLLIISLNAAAGIAFSVFGAVINGYQRYYVNGAASIASSIAVGIANVVVLSLGFGLVPLVATTTVVRLLTFWLYRANAHRVFPGLRLRVGLMRWSRVREMTSFSVYYLLIDWGLRLNYAFDALVIGAFLGPASVTVWTVAQRLSELAQRLANQLNEVLFPTIVDHDTAARTDELRSVFVIGTRLSLAAVLPMAGALMMLADPLVRAWVGAELTGAVRVLQILALVVIVRVGSATALIVLKGAGQHRFVAGVTIVTAFANLALSVALIHPYGLPGVAVGTLIPVTAGAIAITFPAGCRRVGIPVRTAVGVGVWPALWPAFVMFGYLAATRHLVPPSIPAVMLQGAISATAYAVIFVGLGVSAAERSLYVSKALEIKTRALRRLVPENV